MVKATNLEFVKNKHASKNSRINYYILYVSQTFWIFIIMKYDKKYLEELVSKSKCMWDVVEHSGMSKQEGNYRYLRNRISMFKIDISHFENQRAKGRNKRTLENILVKDQFLTLNGNRLKERLYKANLKQPICELCGQDENWKGKKMSLILDHIDGNRENNLLENLRIVCPNCNATLDTHCAKNKRNNIAG